MRNFVSTRRAQLLAALVVFTVAGLTTIRAAQGGARGAGASAAQGGGRGGRAAAPANPDDWRVDPMRGLSAVWRIAGRSDPHTGVTPGVAEGAAEGGRSCPLCGFWSRRLGGKLRRPAFAHPLSARLASASVAVSCRNARCGVANSDGDRDRCGLGTLSGERAPSVLVLPLVLPNPSVRRRSRGLDEFAEIGVHIR